MPFYKIDVDEQQVHYLNLDQIVSVVVKKNPNDDMEANPYVVAVRTSNAEALYDLTVKSEEFAHQLADELMQAGKMKASINGNG